MSLFGQKMDWWDAARKLKFCPRCSSPVVIRRIKESGFNPIDGKPMYRKDIVCTGTKTSRWQKFLNCVGVWDFSCDGEIYPAINGIQDGDDRYV